MAAPPFEAGAVNAMLALLLPDVAVPMAGAPGTTLLVLSPPSLQAGSPPEISVAATADAIRLLSRMRPVGAMLLIWISPSCQCVGLYSAHMVTRTCAAVADET